MTVYEAGSWDLYIKVEYDKKTKQGKAATCVIDRVAPTVKDVSITRTNNSSRQYKIEIEAKDDVSSTSKLKYSFDKGKTWQDEKTKTITSSKTFKVGDIQVKDECGNITWAPKSYEIYISGSDSYYSEDSLCYTKDNMAISEFAINTGYMQGFGNGKFGPDSKIRRCELAAILDRIIDFSGNKNLSTPSYSDLPTDYWATQYIKNIQKYNLIATTGNKFEPNKEMTRGEIAHALCQFLEINNVSLTSHKFKDIKDHRFEQDIEKVFSAGLMEGYSETAFGPDDSLTRAQVVTIINRIINIKDSAVQSGKKFDDVPITFWAYDAILKASF